jgi:hypothetical protein
MQRAGGLLGVVELCGATGLLAKHVIDILEGLFEHSSIGSPSSTSVDFADIKVA